jgi:hypothetical protein
LRRKRRRPRSRRRRRSGRASQGDCVAIVRHALAIYLKGFQALSYKWLRGLFREAFGLGVSEGAFRTIALQSP